MSARGARVPILLVVACSLATVHCAREAEQSAQPKDRAGAALELAPGRTYVLDTGVSARASLPADALQKKAGWTIVPDEKTEHTFKGDAVLVTDRLIVVFRKDGSGAEVYANRPGGPVLRAVIAAAIDEADRRAALAGVKLIANTLGAAEAEAAFLVGGKTATLRCQVTTASAHIVQLTPGAGTAGIVARGSARATVVHEFFGDDLVYLAEEVARDRLILPAENFFLMALDGGNAMVMTAWESSGQTAEVFLSGPAASRVIEGTRISALPDKKVWLAFIEGAGIWHERKGGEQGDKPAVVLDWEPPFAAKWRADFLSFVREDIIAESRPFAERAPADPGACACWLDVRKALVTGSHLAASRHVIVYPIDRTRATPLDVFLPVDIMRNTLGVGPCQYILSLEGGGAGEPPTPDAVMKYVENEFERGSAAAGRDDIARRLAKMLEHMRHAHARIGAYAAFAADLPVLCASTKGKDPAAGPLADRVVRIVNGLTRHIESRRAALKTPDVAAQFAARVVELTAKPDAAECRQLGGELRALGEAEDNVLSECRIAARRVRQECLMAVRDGTAPESVAPIREAAERVLQGK